MPTKKVNRADGERRALLDELKRGSLKPVSEKGLARTVRDLRRTLLGYLDDWHATIRGNVTEARGLLNVVLRERITFTPIVGLDGNPAYELKVPIAFDRLLVSLVPGLDVGMSRVRLASPVGTVEGCRAKLLGIAA